MISFDVAHTKYNYLLAQNNTKPYERNFPAFEKWMVGGECSLEKKKISAPKN